MPPPPPLGPRKKLQRIEHAGHLRFLTFSCYKRLPLFNNNAIKDRFAFHLENARTWCGFRLYAWVIMPEHVHLLIWPHIPPWPVSRVLKRLKYDVSVEVLDRWRTLNAPVLARLGDKGGALHFWQPGGGHDRNIWDDEERREKIDYIHQNPVKRGLVNTPTDWAWSSARWFAGDTSGAVRIDPLPPVRPGVIAPGGTANSGCHGQALSLPTSFGHRSPRQAEHATLSH